LRRQQFLGVSSPLPQLLEVLAACKRVGMPWDKAWQAAVTQALAVTCDEADWREVLDATQSQWMLAYRRRGAAHDRQARAALAKLSVLAEDRLLVDDPGNDCARCGQPLPPRKRRGGRQIYCSERCRRLANWERDRRRSHAAQAA
jgi:predicted nucleic acid-binding Zn ribbon protein